MSSTVTFSVRLSDVSRGTCVSWPPFRCSRRRSLPCPSVDHYRDRPGVRDSDTVELHVVALSASASRLEIAT